jgi:hypothetical protein
MSQEIRHFLVFVEQDKVPGSVPAGDGSLPQLSSALEDHFGARARVLSDAGAEDLVLAPHGRCAEPGRG